MRIDVLTLFPEMFTGVLNQSILKKAQETKSVHYHMTNFREFADNKHHQVDDYPYGGGAGMLLMAQPLFDAVQHIKTQIGESKPRVIMLTPQGKQFNQPLAEELSKENHLIFLCGHYEGFDERVREHLVTDEVSIGDFVLTGGELASMVMIDSIVRLLPGVLGNDVSSHTDSFSTGLLEYPQYTRPADFRGMKVPEVLLSGHHQKIEEWRRKESLRRTYIRRPELIQYDQLTQTERQWLLEFDKGKND